MSESTEDDKKSCLTHNSSSNSSSSPKNSITTPHSLTGQSHDAIDRYHHIGIIKTEDGKVYYQANDKPYGERHIVFVELKITRVSDIDTSNETFRSRFLACFTWLASKKEVDSFYGIEKKEKEEKEEIKKMSENNKHNNKSWLPSWEPRIAFINSNQFCETTWEQVWKYSIDTRKKWGINSKYLGFNPYNGYWIQGMWRGECVFKEEMELESFPFDCQDLTINIKSIYYATKCDLLPFPSPKQDNNNNVNNNSSVTGNTIPLATIPITFVSKDSIVDEWTFHNMLCEFRFSTPEHSRSGSVYPKFLIQIKAKRTWQSYIGLLLVTFGIYLLSLGTFLMGLDEPGDRLGFAVGLILASVVNIQWALESLPKIPYMTIAEIYIYGSFLYLLLITIYSYLAISLFDIFEDIDSYIGWSFFILFFIIHIWFYFFILSAMKQELKQLKKQTIEYRDKKPGKMVELNIPFDDEILVKAANLGVKKNRSCFALCSKSYRNVDDTNLSSNILNYFTKIICGGRMQN